MCESFSTSRYPSSSRRKRKKWIPNSQSITFLPINTYHQPYSQLGTVPMAYMYQLALVGGVSARLHLRCLWWSYFFCSKSSKDTVGHFLDGNFLLLEPSVKTYFSFKLPIIKKTVCNRLFRAWQKKTDKNIVYPMHRSGRIEPISC